MPSRPKGRAVEDIFAERLRQDKKWGEQNHHPLYYLAILGEEYGEACKAAIEGKWENYRKEVTEAAAVAIAMVECFDRNPITEETMGA